MARQTPKGEVMIAIGGAGLLNGEHIPFIEYDNKRKSFVIADSIRLQKTYGLSAFGLYKTNNGFHVRYYYSLVTKRRLEEIVMSARCDENYKTIVCKNYSINRLSGKYKMQDMKYLGTYTATGNTPMAVSKRIMCHSLKKLHHLLMEKKIVPDRWLTDKLKPL